MKEKSLFDTTTVNQFSNDDLGKKQQSFSSYESLFVSIDEDNSSSPPISRRLAFIGEFNSTPYVIVSPRVQKQLIYDARKNNGKY